MYSFLRCEKVAHFMQVFNRIFVLLLVRCLGEGDGRESLRF